MVILEDANRSIAVVQIDVYDKDLLAFGLIL
jgi:hypothetical protein